MEYLPPLSKVFLGQTSKDNMDTMYSTSNSEESTQQIAFSSGSTEDSEHLRDPDFLSNSVRLFNSRDRRSLNVTFRPARCVTEVIPTYLNGTLRQHFSQ